MTVCTYRGGVKGMKLRVVQWNISPDIAAFAGILDAFQDKYHIPRL